MENFDLIKYLAEGKLLKENEGFNVDLYYDKGEDLVDLDAAFKAAPDKLPYDKVLDIIKSYENKKILNDFKSEFPEAESPEENNFSKEDYFEFNERYISDMSEISDIQANWISVFDDTVYEKAGLI
jgi:hypothetical protein